MTTMVDEDSEDEELANEFEKLCTDVQSQISDKLDQARVLVKEAVELSEKHGVPFGGSPSFLRNSYVPKSFVKSKFAKLDPEVVSEISGAYGGWMSDIFSYGGWVHSAVC